MDQFARLVVGYHGCPEPLARDLLLGTLPIRDWRPSTNDWDWLGRGVYFWEHSPDRAFRWAAEQGRRHGFAPAVLGAVIQLGLCFDLLDEAITRVLAEAYEAVAVAFAHEGNFLPQNRGRDGKLRQLDCLVINDCLDQLANKGAHYDTVRAAFLEGEPVYPGASFSRESHIQIAVRNPSCILGVFRPNL